MYVALTAQLRALGARKGGVLLVHTSYRAIRPIEGGPLGVIDALRAAVGLDGRVWELDGQVLLLGVGHDSNTTIHLAELLADVPYRVAKHCTVLRDGHPTRIEYGENDHCCQRFALADAWLRERGLQREGPVGHGVGRLVRSRDVVETVSQQLTRDPLIFLHEPEEGCAECDEARRSLS